ncbi:aminodeoxychorismate synthase component I [Marinobacter confluentis]|uniref:Aminodeoxychorismate synthase component I n=1 Tax=Marinobacter confluentis TaxID=1697557 RepID=A0A4Z1C699_9GAMM|nr:aminodeoxychorismate synthase component I [Marinobacter confluentis]TGN42031.1 aminodeoxychorismate synthase component I [Marinobacter confluentis]
MGTSAYKLIDQATYTQLLTHASAESDFVYLGSVGGGENRGAHTAFSALAADQLTLASGTEPLASAAIAEKLESALEPYREPAASILPCLTGGWIGFISYELGYDTEPKLHRLRRDIPAPLLCAGLYLWLASHNRSTGEYYLWVHPKCAAETRSRLDHWLTTPCSGDAQPWKILHPFRARQSAPEFRASVEQVRSYITAGDCYQANLSQDFTATCSGDPWQAFKALSDANPTAHSAFIRAGRQAVLSVSPERFLKIAGNTVTTSPIKGTRQRGATPEEDVKLADELMASEKDRAENLMIVDLLRNDLSRNATNGTVEVDRLFELESYRNVHHLVSHIRCELAPGVTPMKALLDAFPGGSITGAPKIRAMEIIRELEPHDRGPYCGSVFFRGLDDSLESNIAIRTLFCDGEGKIHCCGGGGVVSDSDPESEYQETLTKVKPLMDYLEGIGSQ